MNLANGIEGEPNGVGSYIAFENDPLDVRDPLGLVAKQAWNAKRAELISRGGWWNVVAFGSSLGEAIVDVTSLGAFGANDRLADRAIAGEITEGQYWSGVAVNTGVRAAAVVTAGAAAPAAAGAVGGGLIVQGAAGGAAAGLAFSTVEVVGTRAGFELISDIDYEQSVADDFKQVAISTAAGTVLGTAFGTAARGDQAILVSRGGTTRVGPHRVGPYKDVQGHHPHQQAARSSNPQYNPERALSVADDGTYVHSEISKAQMRINAALRKSGTDYTLAIEEAGQIEAMEAGGMSRANAIRILKLSRIPLKQQGALDPTRVPGSRRGP